MSAVKVETSVLRAIADTLEARADTDQPLTVMEIRGLADAVRDLAAYRGHPDAATDAGMKDQLILLRPTFGRSLLN